MTKADFENKSLSIIILIGYLFNISLGWRGSLLSTGSGNQVLFYQMGAAFAITASVMAARYTGLRGQQVAASAYILLGITHGISLAALSKTGMNVDREATMAMPMIPALIFMFWCSLFPLWVRLLSIAPILLFASVYFIVHTSEAPIVLTLYSGYGVLQFLELIWGIYIFLDWRKLSTQKKAQ